LTGCDAAKRTLTPLESQRNVLVAKSRRKNKSCRRHVICYIANSLQLKKERFCQFSKSFVAALLIGLVLFMAALASSEALHKLVHHDADEAGHECAVTLFAHGHVESAVCDIPVVTPTVWVETTPHLEFSVFSTAIENLPPGRAPPSVASPLV
jgi:hypothetical protein